MIPLSHPSHNVNSGMIPVSLHPRPAEPADREQIADLLYFEGRVHRHLDWHTALDWLGSPHFWTLDDHGRVVAALACPQDPPGIAWLRLFAFHSQLSGPEAWAPLWEAVRGEISQTEGALVAAIAIKPWLPNILVNSGFAQTQSIVLLEWTLSFLEPCAAPSGVVIRPMRPTDLPAVAQTDAAAFDPLWRNSLGTLEKAFSQAIIATVAEDAGRVIGYQISTGNRSGGHLARLGVRKEAQGRGIGSALVSDFAHRLSSRGLLRITVNTQADNLASLSLYKKMGFVRTGEEYPVFVYQ